MLDWILPELKENTGRIIRLPMERDIAVTDRVLRLLDAPVMQRLKGISQLGLVALVYPGATHSRFEHSLGVYHLACQTLRRLLETDQQFAQDLSQRDATLYLLAALLHDVGHWPYCHPIEDMRLPGVPHHEQQSAAMIESSELETLIRQDWGVAPGEISNFLKGGRDEVSATLPLLYQLMNGPVDIDKIDYLQRDSHHAGVPYGKNFDARRLIGAFCIGPNRDQLVITEKGKTAAEMMVFARYVMFSEVYWHRTVPQCDCHAPADSLRDAGTMELQ